MLWDAGRVYAHRHCPIARRLGSSERQGRLRVRTKELTPTSVGCGRALPRTSLAHPVLLWRKLVKNCQTPPNKIRGECKTQPNFY